MVSYTRPVYALNMAKQCYWTLDRGYDKGKRCGNDAKYTHRRKGYCGAHLAMAMDPERAKRQALLLKRLKTMSANRNFYSSFSYKRS